MKRHVNLFILSWVLLLILTVGLPVPARAEKYMEAASADFHIVLDETGGAEITETWDCFFGGDAITRYRRYYTLPFPREMSFHVSEISMDGVPMHLLEAPDDSRPEGCAAVSTDDDGTTTLEMYLSASNESHTFIIRYYVTNAVTLYNDAAEFHWNLTSERESFDIAELTGLIEIPYGTRDMGLYFWGHGPNENAYFNAIVDDNGMVNQFELYNENIPEDRAVTVRFAMPPELFPGCTRIRGWDGLQDILHEEHGYADLSGSAGETVPMDEDDQTEAFDYESLSWWEKLGWNLRWWLSDIAPFLKIAAIVLSFVPLVFVFLFGKPFEKWALTKTMPKAYGAVRFRPLQAPQYYRGLPDNLKPAMVYKLMSVYPFTEEGAQALQKGSAFAATVLDLVERGLLKLDQNPELTYLVTPGAEQAVETEYERNVIWLYTAAGAAESPKTTKEITDYMRTEYSWCKQHSQKFNGLVYEEYENLGYSLDFPDRKMPLQQLITVGLIWGCCAALGFSLENLLYGLSASIGLCLGALSGLGNALILGRLWENLHPGFRYLNQEGENRYALWNAYGNFLRDFTLFDEREVQDVRVWRRYLVYATALGCSAKVMGVLSMRLPTVYKRLSDDFGLDRLPYDDIIRSVEAIDEEKGYTIRPTVSSSGSDFSDSSRDDDWGGFSDSGGDSDTGSSGSDFD